jgi:hypothetical protein
MAKRRRKRTRTPASEFEQFLDALQDYLKTGATLAPRNAPRGPEFRNAIREFQVLVNNLVRGDIATARRLGRIVDVHTLRRLDERLQQLRAVELTREMTEVLRRTSA